LKQTFWPGEYTLELDEDRRNYTLTNSAGIIAETGRVGGAVGDKLGFKWQPSRQDWAEVRDEVKFSVLTPREASVALQRGIRPLVDDAGNFLRLSMSGTDRARITSTLNALTEELVAVAAELKRNKLTETARILSYQVDTLGQKLREAEGALESFKTRVITQPTEGTVVGAGIALTQPTVMTKFFEDKVSAEIVRRDRQRLEQLLARARTGGIPVDELNTIPAVQQAPNLSSALGELTKYEAGSGR
jgi:hypothetical protein